ncbi:MAG: hypothetical protein P4M05_12015 [Bradyrhizobium sp.]|nr:hypothetical protein [Bradyrhizobium sp.]
MRIIDMALRLYARPEAFEETIAFYEAAQGIACERRFENRERRMSGAKVGLSMARENSPLLSRRNSPVGEFGDQPAR